MKCFKRCVTLEEPEPKSKKRREEKTTRDAGGEREAGIKRHRLILLRRNSRSSVTHKRLQQKEDCLPGVSLSVTRLFKCLLHSSSQCITREIRADVRTESKEGIKVTNKPKE